MKVWSVALALALWGCGGDGAEVDAGALLDSGCGDGGCDSTTADGAGGGDGGAADADTGDGAGADGLADGADGLADGADGVVDAVEPDVAADAVPDGDPDGDPGDGSDAGDVGADDDTTDAEGDTSAPVTECPLSPPFGASSCSGSLHCTYGTECCCGSCDAEYVCDCQGGSFACYATDHCLGAWCSDGCASGRIATPAGCLTCSATMAQVSEVLAAAAEEAGECSNDAECTLTAVDTNCGQVCDLAVRAVDAAAFAEGAGAAAGSWCTDAHLCWGWGPWPPPEAKPTCESTGSALCVEGTCRRVAGCDPDHTSTGDPCDDGNACTVDDVCEAPFVCGGKPVACDDGNPCTDDACDPALGCSNEPNADACDDYTSTCTVGGQCAEGACQASPIPGFTRTYEPSRWARAIAEVPLTMNMVMGGVEVGAEANGFLMWLNPLGEPQGAHPAPGRVTAVAALSGGEALAALEVGPQEGGGKQETAILRMSPDGATHWTRSWPLPAYDREPRLAVHPSGAVVVVWTHEEPWEGRYAVTSLDGAVAESQAFPLGFLVEDPVDGRPAVTATAEGFAIAHSAPGEPKVQITRLDTVGTPVMSFVLPAEPAWPRGILALPEGDLVVWGGSGAPASAARWARRVTLQGSVVWEYAGDVSELIHQSTAALLGHGGDTLVWLSTSTGAVLSSYPLPPSGVATAASCRVLNGIALLGTQWEGAPWTSPAHPWLRRTSWHDDCDGPEEGCAPPGCTQ